MIGGNYQEMLSRVLSEARVKRFALMFLSDDSYQQLEEALEDGRTEDAFRAAHTLKGVCLNLAFTSLREQAVEVTEALRGGDLEKGRELFPELREKYLLTVQTLSELKNS